MFETGSIISPRIFISTSIEASRNETQKAVTTVQVAFHQRFFEGARLQPRRKYRKINAALAAEGACVAPHEFLSTLFST
jgi:hypothetical protein